MWQVGQLRQMSFILQAQYGGLRCDFGQMYYICHNKNEVTGTALTVYSQGCSSGYTPHKVPSFANV